MADQFLRGEHRRFFIFSALAVVAVALFSLGAKAAEASRLHGGELTTVECADIVIGTKRYQYSAAPALDHFSWSGIKIKSATFTNAYHKNEDNTAMRLGKKDELGKVTFNFAEPVRISKARVYCYSFNAECDGNFSAYTDDMDPSDRDYENVPWTTVPDISGVEGEKSVYFYGLDGGDSQLASSLTLDQIQTGQVMVCKIVLTLLVGGSAPQPGDSSESSSSSSLPRPSDGLFGEYDHMDGEVQDYYKNVDLYLEGSELKTSFWKTIRTHTQLNYDNLMDVYAVTDVDPDGYIYDIYSGKEKHKPEDGWRAGAGKEGEGLQREHVIPKSYFNDAHPMYSDAFSVMPADAYSNMRRNDNPYGVVDDPTYETTNGSKLGPNVYPGGPSETVFEPGDEWKGDIARVHFYFVTCYEQQMEIGGWKPYALFDYSSPLGLSDWATDMFLEWAREDPISDRERERNEKVFGVQGNRNPYVDFPTLAEEVFGSADAA